MNHGPNRKIEGERDQLLHAAKRLLDGAPLRSNGNLTISTLAVEADVARHRIYSHHHDLVDEFQAQARGGPTPPHVTALQQQLADAHIRIAELDAANTELKTQVRTLAAVIAEQAHETAADNIIAFPRRVDRYL